MMMRPHCRFVFCANLLLWSVVPWYANSFTILLSNPTTTLTTTPSTSTAVSFSSSLSSSSSCYSSSILRYSPEPGEMSGETTTTTDYLVITSPVLKQLYPALLEHKETYGHPNIPLGSKEGRQCQTLRRLHIQEKLTPEEVEWLDALGFTWHSLEDVYKYADFDDLFQRLVAYETAHPESHFQIPKKFPQDPELGAWVTGIRRLGNEDGGGVHPDHVQRLNAIGFVWQSTRQCGSQFMKQYRAITERVSEEGLTQVLSDDKTLTWIHAQQEALKRGTLSQTRVHYMAQVFGDDWTTL